MNKSEMIKNYILENENEIAEINKPVRRKEKIRVSYKSVVESGCDFVIQRQEEGKSWERLVILVSKDQLYIINEEGRKKKLNMTNLYAFLRDLPKTGFYLKDVSWISILLPKKSAFCDYLWYVLSDDKMRGLMRKGLLYIPDSLITDLDGSTPFVPSNHYIYTNRTFGYQNNMAGLFSPLNRVSPFFDVDSYGMGPQMNAGFGVEHEDPHIHGLSNNFFQFKAPGTRSPMLSKRVEFNSRAPFGAFDPFDDDDQGDDIFRGFGCSCYSMWARFADLCTKLYMDSPGLYTDLIEVFEKKRSCSRKVLFSDYLTKHEMPECRILESFHSFILIRSAFGPEWTRRAMEIYADSGMENVIPYDFLLKILFETNRFINYRAESGYNEFKVAWKFSAEKFLDYLFNDCVKQGFSDDIEGFIARWDNVLNYQKLLYGKIRYKYPDNLASYEHKLAYFIRKQKNDIYNKMWEQRAAESEAYEYANEKYQIIAAKNNDELVTESNNQHNCVDSYEGSVLSGRCKIFFMRSTDPEKVDKSILTIELLANDVIGQVKASCNRAPKMSQLKFVEEWAKEKNLSFDRDEVMAMEW